MGAQLNPGTPWDVAQAIAAAYDFGRFATVIDVGGGRITGVLACALVRVVACGCIACPVHSPCRRVHRCRSRDRRLDALGASGTLSPFACPPWGQVRLRGACVPQVWRNADTGLFGQIVLA